ncbi:MAG: biopolymer transporter ExbD [Planctomycetaceae bacterium]
MPIRFRCEHCSQKLSVTSRKIGSEVACPRCGSPVVVPAEDTIPPHVEPARRSEARTAAAGGAAFVGAGAADQAEEFAFRKVRTEFEEMDLTPMVDVTFLLLIFFMITASFTIQKTIATPDPNPEQQGAQQQLTYDDLEELSLSIAIDDKNTVYVENEAVSTGDRLSDVILDKSNAMNKRDVLLSADDAALHDTVIRVIDACNEARIQKIRLVGGGGGSFD